jgi:hypothetical protein
VTELSSCNPARGWTICLRHDHLSSALFLLDLSRYAASGSSSRLISRVGYRLHDNTQHDLCTSLLAFRCGLVLDWNGNCVLVAARRRCSLTMNAVSTGHPRPWISTSFDIQPTIELNGLGVPLRSNLSVANSSSYFLRNVSFGGSSNPMKS